MYSFNLLAARELEKAQKQQAQRKLGSSSAAGSRASSPSPSKSHKGLKASAQSGASTPARGVKVDQRIFDLSAMNLNQKDEEPVAEEVPKMSIERGKLLQEARSVLDSKESGKKAISLVIIGKSV